MMVGQHIPLTFCTFLFGVCSTVFCKLIIIVPAQYTSQYIYWIRDNCKKNCVSKHNMIQTLYKTRQYKIRNSPFFFRPTTEKSTTYNPEKIIDLIRLNLIYLLEYGAFSCSWPTNLLNSVLLPKHKINQSCGSALGSH